MIIGITGYAGVGKDTLADLLEVEHGFEKRSFASKLKTVYYDIATEGQRQLIDETGWDNAKRINTMIRVGLQGLGAVMRKHFGKDFWIKEAMTYTLEMKEKHYVFSDVRYPNEAEAIRSAGGVIVRLKRDGIFPVNDHDSETLLDSINPDLTIENHSPHSALAEVLELIKWKH